MDQDRPCAEQSNGLRDASGATLRRCYTFEDNGLMQQGSKMHACDQVLTVHALKSSESAAKDLGLDIDRIAATLTDCWHTRVTSGSKMKRLRHVPGNEYRLRLGKNRVVFSVRGAKAYIHIVEGRDSVYRSDSFNIALKRFYEVCGDVGALTTDAARNLGYRCISVNKPVPPYRDSSGFASIGYLLRRNQQRFFNSVLPIEGTLSAPNPRLVIGYGPPGSGKTIVGVDLAIEAFLDRHRVDILVPSKSLIDEYSSQLARAGVTAAAAHGPDPAVRVMRFDEHFADRAGVDINFNREAQILGWARSKIEEPRLKAKLGGLRGRIDSGKVRERLPILIDALLDDDEWWQQFDEWSRRHKDPIIEPMAQQLRAQLKPTQGRTQ